MILNCKARKRSEGYEATVTIPGLRSTKMVTKDGETTYQTASGLKQAARALATKFKMDLEFDDSSYTASTSTKKAVARLTERM